MTDGSGTNHSATLWRAGRRRRPEPLQSFNDNRERLGQCRLGQTDVDRHFVRIAGAGDQIGRVSPVQSNHTDLAPFTTSDCAVTVTVHARAASLNAFHDDSIALAESGHSFPE